VVGGRRSPWVADSQEKLDLLKKLKVRYLNFEARDEGTTLDIKDFMTQHGIRML
jgi:hypothetical protein